MPLTLCSPTSPPTIQSTRLEREGTRASEKRIGWKRRSNSLINGIRRYLWDFAPFSSFSTVSPFVQPSSLFRFLFNARPVRSDTPPEELLARLKDCTGLYYYYVYMDHVRRWVLPTTDHCPFVWHTWRMVKRVVHIRNGGKRNNRVSITFGQWLDGWSEWVSPHWY